MNSIHSKRNQSGAVLVVSLLILVVMTVIGVSSIGTSNLEERISKNFELGVITFQASESAINNVMKASTETDPDYDEDTDYLLEASRAGLDDTSTVVSYDMDPYDKLGDASLDVNATVVYSKFGGCMMSGDSLGTTAAVQCDYYEIRSKAEVSANASQSLHVQGLFRPVPN